MYYDFIILWQVVLSHNYNYSLIFIKAIGPAFYPKQKIIKVEARGDT